MERIASFEKVSYERFREDWKKNYPGTEDTEILRIYEGIQMPRRATRGSAGYDFLAPADLVIPPKGEILVPTGIRVKIADGYVLMIFPRSSLGFKYRLQLNNTVGIIDSDYYHADNEGHIFCKLTNDTYQDKTVEIAAGAGMVQGIFVSFGIIDDDEVSADRYGGFGSTDKR